MDATMILLILSALLGAGLGGTIVGLAQKFTQVSGTLKIDHSDPEKDVYNFEIDDLDCLSSKTKIVLKIENRFDRSQK